MKKSICMFLVLVMLMSLNLLVACTNAEEDVYHSIISDYIEAYEFAVKKNKEGDAAFADIMSLYPTVSYGYVVTLSGSNDIIKPKYFLHDIDNDNVSELFIGTDVTYYEDRANQRIFGVFTCKNGELIDLFGNYIGERDRVYLMDDNNIWRDGSSGAESYGCARYKFAGGESIKIDELYTEQDDIWYYNNAYVTKSHADEILKEQKSKIIYVDWKDVYDYEYVKSSEKTSEISVELNGKKLEFDQPPVMVNDRVLVPMRAIFEALNAAVFFKSDEVEGTVIDALTADMHMLLMSSDSGGRGEWRIRCGTPDSEYKDIQFDVSPLIHNDRTLVSVRVISETLGADVDWNGETKTVIINGDIHEKWKSDEEIEQIRNVDWDEVDDASLAWMEENGYKYVPSQFFFGYDFYGRCRSAYITNNFDEYIYEEYRFITLYHDGTFRVHDQ